MVTSVLVNGFKSCTKDSLTRSPNNNLIYSQAARKDLFGTSSAKTSLKSVPSLMSCPKIFDNDAENCEHKLMTQDKFDAVAFDKYTEEVYSGYDEETEEDIKPKKKVKSSSKK